MFCWSSVVEVYNAGGSKKPDCPNSPGQSVVEVVSLAQGPGFEV